MTMTTPTTPTPTVFPVDEDILRFSMCVADPRPIRLKVCRTSNGAGTTTAIARTWATGDAALCRRCPSHECSVDAGGVCLVQVAGYVSERSAADFSLSAWRERQGVAGPGVDLMADRAGA